MNETWIRLDFKLETTKYDVELLDLKTHWTRYRYEDQQYAIYSRNIIHKFYRFG